MGILMQKIWDKEAQIKEIDFLMRSEGLNYGAALKEVSKRNERRVKYGEQKVVK